MNEKTFNYDVAFSFLAEDEEIVHKIDSLIRGRLNTFVYSKRQGEIAGTDGEKTFNQIFSADARIVVVLHRDRWGKTPWTRIEEIAIRNRAYDEGYDFVLFVPLDSRSSIPQWLPKTQLWFGIERYGIESLANAIENRVQQSGGTIHQLSAVKEAAILAEELKVKQNTERFLNSSEGVARANKEIEELFAEIKRLSGEISNDEIQTAYKSGLDECLVSSKDHKLILAWVRPYSNTLNQSFLLIRLSKRLWWIDERVHERESTLFESKYKFQVNRQEHYGWRAESGDRFFCPSLQFADFLMKKLISEIANSALSS